MNETVVATGAGSSLHFLQAEPGTAGPLVTLANEWTGRCVDSRYILCRYCLDLRRYGVGIDVDIKNASKPGLIHGQSREASYQVIHTCASCQVYVAYVKNVC